MEKHIVGRIIAFIATVVLAGCSGVPSELGFGGSVNQEECDAMIATMLDREHAAADTRIDDLVRALPDTLGDAKDRFLELSEDGPAADSDDPLAEARDFTDTINAVNQRSLDACGVPVFAAASQMMMTNQVCASSFDCDELPHVASSVPCFSASSTVIDPGSLGGDGFSIANYQPVDCTSQEPVELRADGAWVPVPSSTDWMELNEIYMVVVPVPAGTGADDAFRNGWFVPALVPDEERPTTAVISAFETAGGVTHQDLAVGHAVVIGDFRWP